MKTNTQDVKSKGEVVGSCSFPEYDSTAEAVQEMGEKMTLGVINAQVRTNAMNKARAEATGTPSSKILQLKAFQALAKEMDPAELVQLAMDDVAMQRAIDRKVMELKAKDSEEEGEGEGEGDLGDIG